MLPARWCKLLGAQRNELQGYLLKVNTLFYLLMVVFCWQLLQRHISRWKNLNFEELTFHRICSLLSNGRQTIVNNDPTQLVAYMCPKATIYPHSLTLLAKFIGNHLLDVQSGIHEDNKLGRSHHDTDNSHFDITVTVHHKDSVSNIRNSQYRKQGYRMFLCWSSKLIDPCEIWMEF